VKQGTTIYPDTRSAKYIDEARTLEKTMVIISNLKEIKWFIQKIRV
jgi:hypothetical protein